MLANGRQKTPATLFVCRSGFIREARAAECLIHRGGLSQASLLPHWLQLWEQLWEQACLRIGQELKIVRDNMPFGRPAGNHDRLLDYSTAVTGGLFFVPSADLLEALADHQP